MKRRNALLCLLLAMLFALSSVLAGCGSTATPAASNAASSAAASSDAPAATPEAATPATVKFAIFSASGDNQPHFDKMVAAFSKAFPHITLEPEVIGYGDYFTQMQTRIAGGSAPDCYELNYENFVGYAKRDVLLPLDTLFTDSGFDTTAMNANALNAFKADGKQFGLPASFSDVLLFYNKDLFDKAGAAYPTKDWTWKEEQAAAEKIRALGDDIYGINHPIQFWEFYKVVRQNGGSLLNDNMSAFTVNTPQNVETLQFMVDRQLKTNVMPTEAQLAGMGDWDLFKAGRLGMIVTGIWAIPSFTSDCKFNWDVEIEPGMKAKATHFFANGLVISKDTQVPAAAFEWIRFMSASKEVADIRVAAGWELPAITDETVLKAYLDLTPPANRKAVFESLDYLVTPPVIEQFAEMSDIIGAKLTEAATGKKTPAEALEAAQKELEAKIKLN